MASTRNGPAEPATDVAGRIARLQPELSRFARFQLRNDMLAEDVVSETLIAALEGLDGLSSQTSLRAWVFAILRHKIVDCIRLRSREILVAAHDADDIDLDDLLFDETGHHRQPPVEWIGPEHALHERQLFAVLEACMERLPPRLGRIFLMREWLELETGEVCRITGLTSNNVFVMLHRARLRLRECLQQHWYGARAQRP